MLCAIALGLNYSFSSSNLLRERLPVTLGVIRGAVQHPDGNSPHCVISIPASTSGQYGNAQATKIEYMCRYSPAHTMSVSTRMDADQQIGLNCLSMAAYGAQAGIAQTRHFPVSLSILCSSFAIADIIRRERRRGRRCADVASADPHRWR